MVEWEHFGGPDSRGQKHHAIPMNAGRLDVITVDAESPRTLGFTCSQYALLSRCAIETAALERVELVFSIQIIEAKF